VGRVGGSPRDLEVARHHPDFRVRLEVVRALRAMPAEEATMTLVVGYLADAADEVRQQARPLLRGELLGEAAIGELERFVLDDGQPDDLRRCAVDALGQSPRDAAAAALFRVLHPQALIESGATASVRDHAASALRRSPAPDAKAYFEQGLASTVRRVRRACERAAGTG
jgi:HEAT repeat protein